MLRTAIVAILHLRLNEYISPRKVVYTDGVRFGFAEAAGAYWLLEEIALAQHFNRKVSSEELQVWTLIVNNDDRTAVLIWDDGNNNVALRKDILFDFVTDMYIISIYGQV